MGRGPIDVVNSPAILTSAPNKPLAFSLSSDMGYLRHLHGHGVSWFAHPCSAVRRTPSCLTMLCSNPPNSANFRVSYWSNSSCFMWCEGHAGQTGITPPTTGCRESSGKGCSSISGNVPLESRHHQRVLLVGMMDSNVNSVSDCRNWVSLQYSAITARTSLSRLASTTHSSWIAKALR